MREALAFLTPLPGARRPSARALRWFPVVGLAIGFALGGLWWGASRAWPLPVAAAIVVVADLAMTGMLHLDGLADCADGLLPHLGRERRLEVMREPTVGAFGVGAVAVVLVARFAVLATLRPNPLLLAALWCTSRTAMATVVDRVPYARDAARGEGGRDAARGEGGPGPEGAPVQPAGLVSAFQGSRLAAPIVVAGIALAALLASVWSVPAGPVAVGASLIGFGSVVAFAVRRVGGFTGDVLGAAGVIGESLGLVVAAARW